MNVETSQRAKPRFFQFSLRQLLLLFFVLAVLLGILAPRWQKEYQERQRKLASRQLWEAASQGDMDAAARAIEAGADLGVYDPPGNTPLSHAVRTSNLPMLDLLLASGADPNGSFGVGAPAYPLEFAVRRKDLSVARRLLEAGAGPNPVTRTPLVTAIQNGQLPMIELLLEHGADVWRPGEAASEKRGLGGPPVVAAVDSEQPVEVRIQMIRLLAKYGANVGGNYPGGCAMDYAVRNCEAPIADALRECGAEFGPREMAAFNRLDELKRAVHEKPGIVRERFRPFYHAEPGQGPTILGTALRNGNREMAKFLIDAGAPLDTVEEEGQTLLHMAARGGDPELIRLLVDRGLDVNARDIHNTPLTDVAWRGKPQAVAALIQAGADVNARGANGRTALHYAAFANHAEVVRILLAAGADPTIPDANGQTVQGWATNSYKPQKTLGAVQIPPELTPEVIKLLKKGK